MPRAIQNEKVQTIDREFPEIGRIRLRKRMPAGLKDDYNAMITALWRQGRHDVLVSLVQRVFPIEQLYASFASGGLQKLPDAESMVDLEQAWAKWLAKLRGRKEEHRQSASHLRRHRLNGGLIMKAAGAGATLRDLPRTLKQMKEDYDDRPRAFNYFRASVMAFLRQTFTKAHPLYIAVNAIEVLSSKRQRKPNPQSVSQMLALEALLAQGRAVRGEGSGRQPGADLMPALWAMASTGMIPKEYWHDGWQVNELGHSIHIFGEKRDNRDRLIPDLGYCVVPTVTHEYIARELFRLTAGRVHCKDMRNTFMAWMSEAKIPRIRRMLYFGHAAGDVTALYEPWEVAEFLKADSLRLKEWLAEELAVARGEKPVQQGIALAK